MTLTGTSWNLHEKIIFFKHSVFFVFNLVYKGIQAVLGQKVQNSLFFTVCHQKSLYDQFFSQQRFAGELKGI